MKIRRGNEREREREGEEERISDKREKRISDNVPIIANKIVNVFPKYVLADVLPYPIVVITVNE